LDYSQRLRELSRNASEGAIQRKMGSGEWDCGLRVADCGFMSPFNRWREIEIESYINPQSAIRNPQSAIPLPL